MNTDTKNKLVEFNIEECELVLSENYMKFKDFLSQSIYGEGMVGENSYLMLWNGNDICELNDDYEVNEFLTNIMLIGSDGGDTAYGINERGEYIEVPFIGMDDEEVKLIGKNFDEFIDYLWNK